MFPKLSLKLLRSYNILILEKILPCQCISPMEVFCQDNSNEYKRSGVQTGFGNSAFLEQWQKLSYAQSPYFHVGSIVFTTHNALMKKPRTFPFMLAPL